LNSDCNSQLIGGNVRVYFVYNLINDLKIAQLITIITMVKLKSTKDILQGISKLDYLLKISVFQICKSPEDRDAFSINSKTEDNYFGSMRSSILKPQFYQDSDVYRTSE